MLYLPTLSGFGSKTIDPDAQSWFTAYESAGYNFGPNSAAIAQNKSAWNTWVANAKASGAFAKLLYIKPQVWVSNYLGPGIKGSGEQFFSFVSGDYNPASGLTGQSASGKYVQMIGTTLNTTPINDFYFGVYKVGTGTLDASAVFAGSAGGNAGDILFSHVGATRAKGATVTGTPSTSSQGIGNFVVSVNRITSESFDYYLGSSKTVVANTAVLTTNSALTFYGRGALGSSNATLSILLHGFGMTEAQALQLDASTKTLMAAGIWS